MANKSKTHRREMYFYVDDILLENKPFFRKFFGVRLWADYFASFLEGKKRKFTTSPKAMAWKIIESYFDIVIEDMIKGEVVVLPYNCGFIFICINDKYKTDINTDEIKWNIIFIRTGKFNLKVRYNITHKIEVSEKLTERINKEVEKDCSRYTSLIEFYNTIQNKENKLDIIMKYNYANI